MSILLEIIGIKWNTYLHSRSKEKKEWSYNHEIEVRSLKKIGCNFLPHNATMKVK
jgi:hypothetical protein